MLIGQRVFGMALGYEDLNDQEPLRHDPVPRQAHRAAQGVCTPGRQEHAEPAGPAHPTMRLAIGITASAPTRRRSMRCGSSCLVEAHPEPPAGNALDVDVSNDPLHGQPEGGFFHGYYDGYCCLPLYILRGEHLRLARLRRANPDAAAGGQQELARIVGQLRLRWPKVPIILRADSGFCQEALMGWCEGNGVDYVFGLIRNQRLQRAVTRALREARQLAWHRQQPARRERENRIKEAQLDLFAERLSTAALRANQLRLWLSSAAYVLMHTLRRIGLAGTLQGRACACTIRLQLLKIGAIVTVRVRRVKLAMSPACPHQAEYYAAFHHLSAAAR